MKKRIFNLSAGPAILPEEVLTEIESNMSSYQDTGIGVMEMSHRSKEFGEIIASAEKTLRDLLWIPPEYAVLFTTGGATMQFSMVPLNLLLEGQVGDYVLSGLWAEAAFQEAKKFGQVQIAGSSKDKNYRALPTEIQLSKNSAYLHYTSNNTVIGSQFPSEPEVPDALLVCDASSDLLHKKVDVRKYGLIYAGAQKNIGPAGVTIVIVRKDLLDRAPAELPLLLDYRTYANSQSLYNTPPTFPIYVVSLVLNWLKGIGGLDEIERRNREKAALLYAAIDESDFYQGVVEPSVRSLMNVTFRLREEKHIEEFIHEAENNGLSGLRGHRLVGGIRASIYNAFPKAGVEHLVGFMRDFASKRA